jgi:hypothetical protein
VKKSPEEQKHFIPRLRDKGVEGAKKTRQFSFVRLGPALRDELFDFFTRSEPRDAKPA